nr:RNA-directed DNA polymerase, eukaryota [Tanacetum cinerariifolium]
TSLQSNPSSLVFSSSIWCLLSNMGSYRTKEEDVARISTSIYVTNFPESFSAKYLFHSCKQYGYVVDAFIPTKQSKVGKRFGFVRFINVFNVERLVNNLCTIWNDRLKLHANIARFHRNPVNIKKNIPKNDYKFASNKSDNVKKDGGNNWSGSHVPNKGVDTMENGKSFATVLSGKVRSDPIENEVSPAIVLDDDCLYSKDLSKSLLGRGKEVSSLSNLKKALVNEGFDDLIIHYMGELWVLLEFAFDKSKELFFDNLGAGSWFSVLKQAIYDFMPEGRVIWVEIEGIPFKVWLGNTFNRIAAKWGQLLDIDDQEELCFHSKRLCIYTKIRMNIFENLKIVYRGKVCWLRAKEVPGWVPDFLDDSNDEGESEDEVNNDSVGNSRGILCVWDTNSFRRNNGTIADFFVIIRGVWLKTNVNLLIVVVYAPHDSRDKRLLWDYLIHVSNQWDGEIIMMGDFNKVRFKSDRFGSVFNVRGAEVFNSFIANAGLVEVPLGGSAFTWCHKSASKMSKIDRFLISYNLLTTYPNINAITLERFLSDHHPILLRESSHDYGPSPFRFFHHWLALDKFDNFVIDTWRIALGDKSNALRNLMYKLKFLKLKIRGWINMNKNSTTPEISRLNVKLADLDEIIDNGNGTDETVNNRAEILNSIHKLHQIQSTEAAQKAKIKWSVKGDETVRFFHGMINKKRSQQNIRGVMVDGKWIEEPYRVKNQNFQHFKDRFNKPKHDCIDINMSYPRSLSSEQQKDLDRMVSMEEVKRAVWDCGTDKTLGPDGFSFGFYRHFWPTIDKEVFEAVKPISLIGSIYKIVAKILANRNVGVLGDIVNEVQSAFVAERQILDDPYILNGVMQWCKSKKKQALFFKVDFDPTEEFQFFKGLKQGDPLSPFLFILILESLHLSFQRVVDAGMYSGIKLCSSLNLSHLFYADDVMFVEKWSESNISILVHVLECFYKASGLKINMSKSKILGIHVEDVKIKQADSKLSCLVLNTPFLYLGTKVGGSMSRVHVWDEVVEKVMSRLSRWKMKTLSIGGRLTLIKSVLGWHDLGSTKASWVKWSNVLTPIDNGGLGVSSLYALNMGLLLKWMWKFFVQKTSLWTRVIKAIHGVDGKVGQVNNSGARSCWTNIVREVEVLKQQGVNFFDYLQLNVGNGDSINFWEDRWLEGVVLKDKFPRLYALETNVKVSVGAKLKEANLDSSFRRNPRGGIEQVQYEELQDMISLISLSPQPDRFVWSLSNSGTFFVASLRKVIDENRYPGGLSRTRWLKYVPLKVNITAWKIKLDALRTRLNISRRGKWSVRSLPGGMFAMRKLILMMNG